jgi:alkanesulfonate monooxygenase SsuD/methylene tetrahydromethanopterin reductase-like flavin-dependent oxidoreductase (luciferase family)
VTTGSDTPGQRPGRPRRVHLGAHFPGVNNTTIWSDPTSGSQVDIASFVHFARTAERGRFDFLFLAEGLRVREHQGRIHDLDVVGRPDSLTVLAALAAVTDRLGLVATLNSTYNEPYELARQLATLDLLSGGRAGWNLVTSSDAFTGENFRRGGFLARDDRYRRANEFLRLSRTWWDSWQDGRPLPVEHHGDHFDVTGRPTVPPSPQGQPVVLQSGDSDEGRELAAASADAIFSAHASLADGQTFYRDVKGRLARYGRGEDDLKILPAVWFALGDTDADAQERYEHDRWAQVSGPTALQHLEAVWGRDLSGFDPEGPLPTLDLVVPDAPDLQQGRAAIHRDRRGTAEQWTERAEATGWGIRRLVIELTGRAALIGSPATVARTIDEFVQERGGDGFILVPAITPTGLDEFAERVVPLLVERGSYPAEYEGTTLRDHLGLRHPGAGGTTTLSRPERTLTAVAG